MASTPCSMKFIALLVSCLSPNAVFSARDSHEIRRLSNSGGNCRTNSQVEFEDSKDHHLANLEPQGLAQTQVSGEVVPSQILATLGDIGLGRRGRLAGEAGIEAVSFNLQRVLEADQFEHIKQFAYEDIRFQRTGGADGWADVNMRLADDIRPNNGTKYGFVHQEDWLKAPGSFDDFFVFRNPALEIIAAYKIVPGQALKFRKAQVKNCPNEKFLWPTTMDPMDKWASHFNWVHANEGDGGEKGAFVYKLVDGHSCVAMQMMEPHQWDNPRPRKLY